MYLTVTSDLYMHTHPCAQTYTQTHEKEGALDPSIDKLNQEEEDSLLKEKCVWMSPNQRENVFLRI